MAPSVVVTIPTKRKLVAIELSNTMKKFSRPNRLTQPSRKSSVLVKQKGQSLVDMAPLTVVASKQDAKQKC